MSNWTVDNRTLEELGVSSLALDLVNGAEDACVLRLVDSGTPRAAWNWGDRHVIREDDHIRFVGWVTNTPSSAAAGDAGPEITLSGPWWWLGRIAFAREIEGTIYSTVNLYYLNGTWRTPVEAANEILQWAAGRSGGAFTVGTINPSATPGQPPPEWCEGIFCADAMRKVMRWAPDSVLRTDYTTGVPKMEWIKPGLGTQFSYQTGVAPLVSATLERNYELVPDGIVISYEGSNTNYDEVVPSEIVSSYPPGVRPGDPGVMVATFAMDSAAGYTDIARDFFLLTRAFEWGGVINLTGGWWGIRPGDAVIVRGREEWSGSTALVQRVNFEPRTGSTTVTLGAPTQLGVSDLYDLLWMLSAESGADAAPVLETVSFQVYKLRATIAPYADVVRIAPGFVGDGTQSVMPTWQGKLLDSAVYPNDKLTLSYRKQFFLKVVWRPDVLTFSGYDALAVFLETYRAASTGTIISAEIVESRENNTAPVVNPGTGVVIDGTFYFPIATAAEADGELEVTQHNSGDMQLLFAPPNNLYIIRQ